MCGIVAYLGPNSAHSVLIEGPKRLEYRGYDAAGGATLAGGKMTALRSDDRSTTDSQQDVPLPADGAETA